MKGYTCFNTCFYFFPAIIILLLLFVTTYAYSLELNEKDYYISNFGINSGKPFITVQGTAGGSYDPSMGDEGYEAYVFDTDKGVFQVTVAEGLSSEVKPYYSAAKIVSDEIKSGNCLMTAETDGKPRFDGNTVEFVDSNITFTKVNKVYTILVTSDDPDEECSTGEHISKIFSILTKPAFTPD